MSGSDATEPVPTEPVPTEPATTEPTTTASDVVETDAPGAGVPEPAVRRAAQVRAVVARASTAALVLAVVAAVVVLGGQRPLADPVAAPPLQVPVPAASSTLVCPGPVRLATEPEPGQDAAYDPQFDPAPGASVSTLRALTADGSGGRLRPLDAAAAGTQVLDPGTGVEVEGLDAARVLEADPADDGPAQAAGTVAVTTTEGDLRGLVASSCQRPASETWLVGGSTELGSSARLVLQNPGGTAATAEVALWGPSGEVELAGAPTFLVPPGTERVVLLEGVAAEQRRVVVRLTSSGGLLTGYVQDSSLRGLVPSGVDLVVAGQRPAEQQVVPGLVLPPADIGDADTAQLRILAPAGSEDGSVDVTVTLLGPDGPVDLPGAMDLTLDAGTVVDVPLAGVPSGVYTAVVTADAPVVAGALLTRRGEASAGGSAPLERAWAPSVAPGPGLLAVPPGVTGTLALAALAGGGDESPVQVTVEGFDAQGVPLGTWPVEIRPGTTTAVRLDELGASAEGGEGAVPAAVAVRTDGARVVWALMAAVVRPDGPLVSVVAPVAPQPAQGEVAVRLR